MIRVFERYFSNILSVKMIIGSVKELSSPPSRDDLTDKERFCQTIAKLSFFLSLFLSNTKEIYRCLEESLSDDPSFRTTFFKRSLRSFHRKLRNIRNGKNGRERGSRNSRAAGSSSGTTISKAQRTRRSKRAVLQ